MLIILFFKEVLIYLIVVVNFYYCDLILFLTKRRYICIYKNKFYYLKNR